jgi:ubiquinone/menaquinone biosynthesis C-methylase UbiE
MFCDKNEKFYEEWSNKTPEEISYDIMAAIRKAKIIASSMPNGMTSNINSILDFGCGYGAFVKHFQDALKIPKAIGVDFSSSAINVANKQFANGSLAFYRLQTLDISKNSDFLLSIIPNKVDCILLIDLLEHVPNCKDLIANLSKFTKYFIIKLPIESSFFDNYILTKEYPGSTHSNGHLREFDANNVHYFIRQLGLTPIFESLYVYNIQDIFPPQFNVYSTRQKIIRFSLKNFKRLMMTFLPKKLFLRVIGGGGYFCLATYNEQNILSQ